jgi:Na+-translocating ferredoxin:NAD+ oxidoreductase subunit B
MKRQGVAVVREEQCIGCTLCIQACPVDAIVGVQGQMHSVVESWCIGCALCVPPCPVDCIDMLAAKAPWTAALKNAAGERARRRRRRLLAEAAIPERKDRRAIIAQALARKRRA